VAAENGCRGDKPIDGDPAGAVSTPCIPQEHAALMSRMNAFQRMHHENRRNAERSQRDEKSFQHLSSSEQPARLRIDERADQPCDRSIACVTRFTFSKQEFAMLRQSLAAALLLAFLAGTSRGEEPSKAGSAGPAFEKLKALAGTWVEAGPDGKPTDKVVSIVRVTAGGSVVHETLFPGDPMEMISVYHLDKGDLLMTHYCALGNQPQMKADPAAPKNQIQWQFVGGTNLDPSKDMHMHGSTVTFVDADHLEIEGEAWADGKPCPEHCGSMKLVRQK
jgi:hypothetical protein